MPSEPLISVIIPTYNEADTLGIAIQSMIDQTYKNLEIIVVDDGSTDTTEKVVQTFIEKDSRIQYLKCPHVDPYRTDMRGVNIGVGWLARNYAMEKSRGEWITFQDADDASLLNRIEIQHNLAVQYNAVCITTSLFPFKEEFLNKQLDVGRLLKEEKDIIVSPTEINALAQRIKGLLMRDWFPHHYIPFVFKKRLPTRLLFIRTKESYPGVDGIPFFKRETIEHVQFRPRHKRVWPSLSGRGVGRDHVFQLAEKYGRSYSFKLPLYLWRTRDAHNPYPGWEKYLV